MKIILFFATLMFDIALGISFLIGIYTKMSGEKVVLLSLGCFLLTLACMYLGDSVDEDFRNKK